MLLVYVFFLMYLSQVCLLRNQAKRGEEMARWLFSHMTWNFMVPEDAFIFNRLCHSTLDLLCGPLLSSFLCIKNQTFYLPI